MASSSKKNTIKLEYKNTLVNFSSSIMKYYGSPVEYPTHALTDYLLSKKYRHVAVILLDGLGYNIVEENASNGSILKTHQIMKLNSVYPPTTAAATTSLLTGKAPIETGWLGWHEYLSEDDPSVVLFKNEIYKTGEAFEKYQVEDKIGVEKFYNKVKRAQTYTIYPSWSKENPVNSFDEALLKLNENLNKDEANFTYLYWDEPDKSIHEYGTSSPVIKFLLQDYEAKIRDFGENLPDNSIVFVLADHGLIDCELFDINDYPLFKDTLRKDISGEARFTSFYLKDGKEKEFEDLFVENFGEHFNLYKRDELIKSKLCGINKPHELVNIVLGDYVAIAKSNYAFVDGIKEDTFKAFHAGFTKDELEVPVIMFKRKDIVLE